MNLKTKHILAVSAVAGIAGVIGYLIGNKFGYERGYSDSGTMSEEGIEWVEAPDIYRAVLGVTHIPKSFLKTTKCIKTDHGTHALRRKEITHNPEWSELTKDDISFMDKRARGKKADKLIWDELDTKRYHNTVENYVSKEEDQNESDETDVENLRTQGETEYTSNEPYLVTEDDVFSSETDADDVVQLSYYEADDVLVDSFDEIIHEREAIVGSVFKDNFGYGSNDPSVVYVRSPRTGRDYEITLEKGSYEMEVLGADEEQYQNAVKFFKLGDE